MLDRLATSTLPRLGLLLASIAVCALSAAADDVVLENQLVRWSIGEDACTKSFVVKASGKDLAAGEMPTPLAMLRNASGWHPAESISEGDGTWTVRFAGNQGSVRLKVAAEPTHFYFALQGGVPDGTQQLALVRLPLNVPRETIGHYWPLAQVGGMHVGLARLCPYLRHRIAYGTTGTTFVSEAVQSTGFDGIRLAVFVTPREKTLEAIEQLELKYGLPHLTLGGVWFRRSKALEEPYLFTDLTAGNVDEVIAFAKRGGFGYVLTFSGTWSTSLGHYAVNERSFPGGMAGLRQTADKLHAAGLKLGIHLLSACISVNDPYVRPLPDERLAVARSFALAEDLSAEATEIPVEGSLAGMTREDSYATAGCDLWIGDEIVTYGDYRESPPLFTKCRRGRFGTKAAAHEAGEPVRYLLRRYNMYLPNPTTDLLPEIAQRIADVCNECGVDMIYFDGGEAMNATGRGWHDAHWIHREVARRLKREVLITGSGGNGGYGWHVHMRGNANDGVYLATKRYMDDHKIPQRIEWYHRNLAAAESGWLNLRSACEAYPATMPDEWEYFCAKSLAYEAPVSLHMHTRYFHDNGRAGEILDIVHRYQQARQAGGFSPAAMTRLKERGKEFELFADEEGKFAFRPIQYGPERLVRSDVEGDDAWQLDNPFARQPLSLRLRVRPALRDFGHEENVVLFDPADAPVAWESGSHWGTTVEASRSADVTRGGQPSLRLVGQAGKKTVGARGWVSLEYAERPNIVENRSIGLWVHGDASGALLDVQLVEPSLIRAKDHLVRIDFEGWRYVRIIDPATDATFDYHLFRHKGNLAGFDYRHVRQLRLQLLDVPTDRPCTVHVGRIEALREVPRPLSRPAVAARGKLLALPFVLQPQDQLELSPDGRCVWYDRNNFVKGQTRLEGVPFLPAGRSTLELTSEAAMPFVYVTPILRGEARFR